MGLSFFLDTYAMYEIIKDNQNYKKFDGYNVITTSLNLMELFYSLAKLHPEFADRYYDLFKDIIVELDDQTIKDAMFFRLKNKKKKLSYADCIGYVIAKQRAMKFLTGDKEFKGMECVEWVK